MSTFFGPDFFSANRDKLRAAMGNDTPIIITGNGVMQRSGDEPSAFHQDSSFWYLTGLNGADLTLVMLATETYVIVPTLSFVREAFDGAHDLASYAARSGITMYVNERDGWKRLREDVRGTSEIASIASSPAHLKQYGVYSLPFRRNLLAKLKRANSQARIRDIRPELASLRCLKQPEELRALQAAIDITGDTLQELSKPHILGAATYEYELEAALSYGFRRRGAKGHGFAPIVGAGTHTTTLHHMENDGPIETTDLIVLDVGAEVEHYSADITRTVSRGPITGRQAEIFRAVQAVQDFALDLIRPGQLQRDYENQVELYMGEQLRSLGLISEPTHDAIRHYFPHATSHFLGLDTHDVGDYRAPWQENMVITCEPGIYIPQEGIGVRLEDDVLITATGHRVLSAACPRELTPVQ